MKCIAATVLLVGWTLFISVIPALAEPCPRLVFHDLETGAPLLEIPVRYSRPFTIRYIHSVDISPVYEVFQADRERGIVLTDTYFRMFGAGMGHWEGHGTLMQEGKWTRITGMDYPLGRFVLRIGQPGVDHTLLIGYREFNLSETAAGHRVAVYLEKRRGPCPSLDVSPR
ncbi:MAG: DUF1850 domain-containing protein [Thermodesulfobacteriota bacterium]